MKRLSILFGTLLIIGCSPKSGIKKGTFEIYEKDSLVGKIYRLESYQIEKYPNGNELIAKIEYETDSTYYLSGIEKKKTKVDSIIWLNRYWKIGNNKFKIVAVASNIKLDYKYEATLLKVNEEIEKEYLSRLKILNEN